ncbi:MAG: hypothetical protein AAF490_28315 [Chloroflexota bacterium]
MLSNHTIRRRSRLAWLVLVGSFFACLLLTISLPFAVNRFLQTSTEQLDVLVQANQGTVRIDNVSGGSDALILGDSGLLIRNGSTVVTGNTETAVWVVSQMSLDTEEDRLMRLQVFSNTIVRLVEANTPRFTLSNNPHDVEIKLESGRLRLTLADGERPLMLKLNTPQSNVEISEPGQYSIVVTNEATEVTVEEGNAVVASADVAEGVGEVMLLTSNTRARVPTGSGPIGREGTDRNLIQNGSFIAGQEMWNFYTWNVDLEDQPPGITALDAPNGETRLQVLRDGIGHADFRIRQNIMQDVTALDGLRLAITFRINGQTLGVCGVVGSECPLFVRINYLDELGISQVWQHGFYGVGEPDPANTPDACINCAGIQSPHEFVPLGQDYFYEIDFPTELAVRGALPPRYIESIELVTSGHSFNVELFDVSLLAIE